MINCRNCINWVDESLAQIEADAGHHPHLFNGCRIFGHVENSTSLPSCPHYVQSQNLFTLCVTCGITVPKVRLQKPPSHYIRENFVITTAGVFDHAPLMCALEALGDERVMFSVDYPLEYPHQAAAFIESAPLSEERRAKICYGNAARVLKI